MIRDSIISDVYYDVGGPVVGFLSSAKTEYHHYNGGSYVTPNEDRLCG